MAEPGSTLEGPQDWNLNRILDKHSTGGVVINNMYTYSTQKTSFTVWANNNSDDFLVRCMAEDEHSTGGVGDKTYMCTKDYTVWANNSDEFLVRCMAESGSTLEWPQDWDLNRVVDKHSTGGVGDKEYTELGYYYLFILLVHKMYYWFPFHGTRLRSEFIDQSTFDELQ